MNIPGNYTNNFELAIFEALLNAVLFYSLHISSILSSHFIKRMGYLS